MSNQLPLRILSLDGGGVRGIATLQVLSEVMAQLRRTHRATNLTPLESNRPCDYFDLICGTSTGGLIAIMLGRLGYDVETAIDKYNSLAKTIFSEEGFEPNALFDHTRLEKAIKNVIVRSGSGSMNADALFEQREIIPGDNSCRTFVVTTLLRGTGAQAERLRTYGTETEDAFPGKIWEAARATSAAPTFFLPIKVAGLTYGDGGTGWNNPTVEAINEAHQIWPNRPIGCIVSIGTGLEDPRQLKGKAHAAMPGLVGSMLHRVAPSKDFKIAVAEYCVKCLTSCEKTHEEIASNLDRNRLVGKYFRLNPDQGFSKIQLWEWEKLEDMATLARDYMRKGDMIELKQIIARILLNPRLQKKVELNENLNTARMSTVNRRHATGMSIGQTQAWQALLEGTLQQTIEADQTFTVSDASRALEGYPDDDPSYSEAAIKSLELSLDSAKRRIIETILLDSLRFSTMSNRYEDVSPAHGKTFQWIFEDETNIKKPWSNFMHWLTQENGIYWVNGKAGSGKSTLMRHIYDNPQTREALKEWAGDTQLIVSEWFFWNTGSLDQRSQTGLLRGLLYSALSQCKSLIPVVLFEHWKLRVPRPTRIIQALPPISWSLSKLKEAFNVLIEQQLIPAKICLFVDGLDEYDGDHTEIADLFQTVVLSRDVKVCLSSRPLHTFETRFRAVPGLRLQDLTFDDIQRYVSDNLQYNSKMVQLARDESGAHNLVLEIVDKAEGVFLWVKLVVQSLLTGLRNHDHISDLRKRLSILPAGLENLFRHMLKGIETVYMEQAAQIFQIYRAAQDQNPTAPAPLTCIELSLALERNTELALIAEIKPFSVEEAVKRCEIVGSILRTRCGGLLEIHGYGPHYNIMPTPKYLSISYLHRTVRDFLELPDIWSKLIKWTEATDFTPSRTLLRSSILYLKWATYEPLEDDITYGELTPLFWALKAMRHAHFAEIQTGEADPALLHELDQVVAYLVQDRTKGPKDHWSNYTSPRYHRATDWQDSFLSLVIQFDLRNYVNRRLGSGDRVLKSKQGRPLLDYAIRQTPFWPLPLPRLSPEMVEILFKHGARSGEKSDGPKSDGRTCWEYVLQQLLLLKPSGGLLIDDWLPIIRIFVRYDADPNLKLRWATSAYPSFEEPNYLLAGEYIAKAFGSKYPAETLEIQDILQQKVNEINEMNSETKNSSITGLLKWTKLTPW